MLTNRLRSYQYRLIGNRAANFDRSRLTHFDKMRIDGDQGFNARHFYEDRIMENNLGRLFDE